MTTYHPVAGPVLLFALNDRLISVLTYVRQEYVSAKTVIGDDPPIASVSNQKIVAVVGVAGGAALNTHNNLMTMDLIKNDLFYLNKISA